MTRRRMREAGPVTKVVTLATAVAVVGCGEQAERTPPPAGDLEIAGSYQIVSAVDLTTSTLFPEPVYGFFEELRSLRDDPAATFFNLLEQAGVPLAGSLLAALPGPIANRLKGWINDYVFGATFQGSPVRTELDLLLAQASTVLTRFKLGSALELQAPDGDGAADATHTLRTLRFALWEGTVNVVVPIDLPVVTLPGEVFVTSTATAALISAGRVGADRHLTLDDHAFGIPYGRLAFSALNLGSEQRYGADLRGALGALFACPALGASVAQRCLLGVCVGHAADWTAVCERGLDEVVRRIRERIEALNFNALRLQQGDAAMWDAPGMTGATKDLRIDRLADGIWEARIDIGMGPRAVPATFDGVRASN